MDKISRGGQSPGQIHRLTPQGLVKLTIIHGPLSHAWRFDAKLDLRPC